MITYDFILAMTKKFWAVFMIYWLVAHLRAVLLMYHHRLPPPAPLLELHIAVDNRARMVGFLVVHGERDGASVTDGHKSQSSQDGSNWYTIQNLRLHASLVNNC
jgi:hypothetical protein